MNLKKTALIAEILGGAGIIVSILYLGYEVSQNSKNTEIANHLALVEQIGLMRTLHMTDETMSALILNGAAELSSLSDVERDQFSWYVQHTMDLWETALLIDERGGLPIGTWDLWNHGWCEFTRRPGFIEEWESGMSENFTVQFRNNIDSCFAK